MNQLYPRNLRIGQIVEFRCNAMPTDRCMIVSARNETGAQDAISLDAHQYRTVVPERVFDHTARFKEIGFYYSQELTIAPRLSVIKLILKRFEFGRNPRPYMLSLPTTGHVIRVDKIEEALLLAQHQLPLSRSDMWQKIYDQLSYHHQLKPL